MQILYAFLTQKSVLGCFLAIVIPGIILCILIAISGWFLMRKDENIIREEPLPKGQRGKIMAKRTVHAVPALLMPFIILGGIYGGIMTATEAAAVSIIYSIPVSMWIYKGMKARDMKKVFTDTACTTGVVMVMVGFVMMFARVLTLEKFPQTVLEVFMGISDNKYVILLMVNIFMVIIGMIMDDTSGTILITPILMPLLENIGVSPYQFAAIIGVNMGMVMENAVAQALVCSGHELFFHRFDRYEIDFLLTSGKKLLPIERILTVSFEARLSLAPAITDMAAKATTARNNFLRFMIIYSAPILTRKRSIVFSIRQAMVIGPTPPGTGVIAEAFGSTLAKSTSPQSFPVSGSLSMPTSMTATPSFTMSPVTNFGLPIATTRISAWRVISARSFVREWQMVTVAFRSSRSFETGSPTIWLRPMTTAFLPSIGTLASSSSFMMPFGVQGMV